MNHRSHPRFDYLLNRIQIAEGATRNMAKVTYMAMPVEIY
jgi:hypothetical protein